MKGMFRKFSKKFSKDKGGQGHQSSASAGTPASTASTTLAAPTATSASATQSAPTSASPPPPSAGAVLMSPSLSSSPSPSPSAVLKLSGPSSSSPPPISSTPPSSHSHHLPLDSSEGKPIGKRSTTSSARSSGSGAAALGLPSSSPGGSLSAGERKDGDAGVNGLVANGAADDDDDDDSASSPSSPHQLGRADLLKPIASLSEPSTPPQSSASLSSSSGPASSPSSAKQALFIHKLRLCCVTFDWSKDGDPSSAASAMASPLSLNPAASKDARAKESKRQQLLELLDYVGKAKSIYNDATLHELMHMIAVNLFRALPPRSAELPSDEDEPVQEPSWPHLQIVYELFLRFIVNNDIDIRTLKKHIHAQFVLHLLELFDSEDHRERDYLKTILHRIYAKFMSLRAFIRKAINHVFYTFIYEQERHSGIAELLEILGSIINGFALPLKHEHKLFLRKVLIPMHKVRTLHHFHQQLSYCISQFVDKDPELAVPVLSGLLQYWPISNSSKEVLFLNELEQVLELTQPEEFGLLVPALFRRVSASIASPHFQVAERALFLWHNEYISHLIAQHREEILPILYPVLSASASPAAGSLSLTPTILSGDPAATEGSAAAAAAAAEAAESRGAHWNPTVNNLTANVLKIFVELDAPLVETVRAERKERQERRERERQQRDREWRRLLEQEAAKRMEGSDDGHEVAAAASSSEPSTKEDGKEELDEPSEVTFTVDSAQGEDSASAVHFASGPSMTSTPLLSSHSPPPNGVVASGEAS